MVIQICDSTQELVYNTNGSIRCSYAKNDAASDTNQLFKTVIQICDSTQELVCDTNGSMRCSHAKSDAASDTNYLFKIQSYKFVILHRNWYLIQMAAYDVHMPKVMLPATQTICLKYSHTNFQLDVGIGIRYQWLHTMFICQK